MHTSPLPEQQSAGLILQQFSQGDSSSALSELRQLVNDIHAAIPEKQRIGKGITWTLQRAAGLLVEECTEPRQMRELAGQIEAALPADDRLVGIPMILMAEYGVGDPLPALTYFRGAANNPGWMGREFAQFAFRRMILPQRPLVFLFLEEMAQSTEPNQRRFCGETLRPVVENQWLQKVPQASLAVLRHLFREPHPYPRTSVGNNLSDLSRRNPELIFAIVEELVSTGDANSYWIAYRACRNLVKHSPKRVMDALRVDEYHYKDRNVSRDEIKD